MFPLRLRHVLACLAVLALSCSESGDGNGGKLRELFAIDDRLAAELCECGVASCEQVDRSCHRDVALDHASELQSWADCAVEASIDAETCVKAADCDIQAISECFAEQVCPDIPARTAMALEEDYERSCDDVVVGGDGDGDGDGDGVSPNDFECADGQVIYSIWVCDGTAQCADSSDETQAACDSVGLTRVTMPMFTCVDDTEIPLDFVCDTEDDCPDGADEARCFTCPFESATIRLSMVCDGVPDCTLGDDEQVPGCMGEASSLFACGNDERVFAHDVCDGTPDCTKGDDEEICFACADDPARVMRTSLRCDGVPDCEDAGDEQGCGPLPTAVEVCTEMATPVAGTTASAECLACTCDAAAAETLACDAACWAALECISTNCGEAMGNDRLTCIVGNCMSAALNMPAQDLFEAAGATCSELCPALVSTSPLP
jgi:hypothetical protein